MAMTTSPEDVSVEYYLKMMMDIANDWPRNFLPSENVYCDHPLKYFSGRDPRILHNGRYFFAYRTEDSGKTDGCESGCWRIMSPDQLIKSKETGKILGFKRVLKFCEAEKPKSVFRFWEREKRRVQDKRVWVMEEYRLARRRKQHSVICKIRLLAPNSLGFLLANHVRGYHM